ncbi:DUF4426 domain-containing protein [Motilimonas pumila]|uniref:DUF4426 domain-containing protein n=1 Tax=Motilimonas pumila TaxID=2303987 RepID=A0A418YAP4_9GAMM|nr:DUF4426 domain-containing protein [Motilimonas pumila]RJG40030.1 DUF4426 domain-containing protein [Motilimonas pumila]
MKTLAYRCLFLAAILLCAPVKAEQKQQFANQEVHYVAFPSTFLTPEIAKTYQLTRSRYKGVINISVLDTQQVGNPSIAAKLTGSAKNLLGNRVELTFREVKEGPATYYLAEVPYRNEETYNFDIRIEAQGKANKLKFMHKFYVE